MKVHGAFGLFKGALIAPNLGRGHIDDQGQEQQSPSQGFQSVGDGLPGFRIPLRAFYPKTLKP